jgi:hypothetical protein
MVEKATGRSRISAQDMVIWGKGWYAGEDVKTIKKCLKKSWLAKCIGQLQEEKSTGELHQMVMASHDRNLTT